MSAICPINRHNRSYQNWSKAALTNLMPEMLHAVRDLEAEQVDENIHIFLKEQNVFFLLK
jgi:hypothetical protein